MTSPLRIILLVGSALSLSGCIKEVRVPLPSPLSTVGGARPMVGRGFEFVMEFGDGVWGQEQERAEMVGGGLGYAFGGRFEVLYSLFQSTREVQIDSSSRETHPGTTAQLARGKWTIGEAGDPRLSVGLHLAHTWADRHRSGFQSEELKALDVAIPVEFQLLNRPPSPDGDTRRELSVYAGPRTLVQTMYDRPTKERERGTLKAILVGLKARLNKIALIGELNFAWTPSMELGGIRSEPGFILLPMLGVRYLLPRNEPG